MTLKQKIKFIKKYVKNYVVIKKWIYLNDRYKEPHGIAMSIDTFNKIIYLNKFWLNKVNDLVVIKSVLLHEIGHFKTKYLSQRLWERELYAQVWACREAYRKKASTVYYNLVAEIMLWGYPKYLNWNSNERKYILAHKAALNKKVIQIKLSEDKKMSLFMDYYKIF